MRERSRKSARVNKKRKKNNALSNLNDALRNRRRFNAKILLCSKTEALLNLIPLFVLKAIENKMQQL